MTTWTPYVVRGGDYLARLAARFGFSAADVWNDPRNAALKDSRANPEVLMPGDVLFLPAREPVPTPLSAGASNAYVAEAPEVTVTVVLRAGTVPLGGQKYVIRGLGKPLISTSEPDGRITFGVPPVIDEVEIFLPERNEVYPVHIGWLDPETVPSGARHRLANLGYYGYGYEERELEDPAAYGRALSAFQRDHGLSVTGTLDSATADALRITHGA